MRQSRHSENFPTSQSNTVQRLVIDPEQCNGSALLLTAEQEHYLRRVLRLQEGDRFLALDGRGQIWQAEVAATGARLGAAIASETELPVAVTLLVALPKGSGFEEIVRSGTELGASCFLPIQAARSLLRPSAQKVSRWQRIAREAAEQSERALVPSVAAPLSLTAALAAATGPTRRYACIARGERAHLATLCADLHRGESVAIATGPEGGWTEAERDQLLAAGFVPASLGQRVLRAVTAPLAALALVAASAESARDDANPRLCTVAQPEPPV